MMAQTDSPKDNEILLKQALQESVLVEGRQPFHLVLEIAPAVMSLPHQRVAPPSMHGSMEVFWASPGRYKVVLKTPSFQQTKTVDGERVEEQDEGEFYPRWLDNFVKALLEPVPEKQMPKLLAERMTGVVAIHRVDKPWDPGAASFTIRQATIEMPRCLQTSDRPGGITEEMSEARICFDASYPWVESTLDFTRYVSFKDYEQFGKQMVPRTWSNDIPENIFVEGRVQTLEKLSKAECVSCDDTDGGERTNAHGVPLAQRDWRSGREPAGIRLACGGYRNARRLDDCVCPDRSNGTDQGIVLGQLGQL